MFSIRALSSGPASPVSYEAGAMARHVTWLKFCVIQCVILHDEAKLASLMPAVNMTHQLVHGILT